MCCNLAKGRVEFEDSWLIKSSFITKDEMKACQLTRTKIQQKKNQKKKPGKLTSRMNNTCTVPGIVNALLDSTD
jgi:hypothetical protein